MEFELISNQRFKALWKILNCGKNKANSKEITS